MKNMPSFTIKLIEYSILQTMITYLPKELIITILQLSIESKNDLLNLSLSCTHFNKLKFLSIKKIGYKQYPNIKDNHVSELKKLNIS